MNRINIIGNKIGFLNTLNKGIQEVSILHIDGECRPSGPAQNSILYITVRSNGSIIANYIPWVGYFDLDRELIKYPQKWTLVEPSEKVKYTNVIWQPFIEKG